MTTLTEEARWANLRDDLTAQFETWSLAGAEYRATAIVRELRRDGWRVPLPDHAVRSEALGAGRKLSADRIRQHMDACRAALRSGPAE